MLSIHPTDATPMRILPAALAATLSLFAIAPTGQGDDLIRPSDESHFRAIVTVLSGDEFGGRGVGTAGGARARDWIADGFRTLGLESISDGEPFRQPFRLDDGTEACNSSEHVAVTGTLAGEWVIVSAHYDHLGTKAEAPGGPPRIFHGADDNASGVAAMLLIAERLQKATPRESCRSVLFLAFDAEERGLLGAKHYVEHPAVPLEKTAAVVNFDMVGRLESRQAVCGGCAIVPEFMTILGRIQSETGVTIEGRFGGVARSDQAPFLEKRIPAVHFNTGLYPEYHHADDTADRVDHAGGAKIAAIGGTFVDALIVTAARWPYRNSTLAQHPARHSPGLGPGSDSERPGAKRDVIRKFCSFVRAVRRRSWDSAPGDELAAIDGIPIERVEDAVSIVPRLRFDRAIPSNCFATGQPST